MNVKAIVFSAVALLGCGSLLWAGLGAAGDGHEAEHYGTSYTTGEHEKVRVLQQQGDILSLEQILESARQHHDGRVLETELEKKRGGYVYEVEMVDSAGQVWEMKFDAGTGELLKEERED